MKKNIYFLKKLNSLDLFLFKNTTQQACSKKNNFLDQLPKLQFFQTITKRFDFNTNLPSIFRNTGFEPRFLDFKKNSLRGRTYFFFFNKFLINFLESLFRKFILMNIKKGSNKLVIKQISYRKFFSKYFKKNLKISKRIIGIIYYSLLLKDSSIFTNFFKNSLEKLNIKLHKKLFLGLKKIIKDLFLPIFNYLGVLGVFFNVKGKIGVSGSAKKRRYFFSYGSHSLTTRTVKVDIQHVPVWTFTGVLGFSFLIFF